METTRAKTDSREAVSDLLVRGRARLGPGEEAWLESEVLLAHALGRSREWLHAHSEEVPSEALRLCFLGLLEERAGSGCPVAYLTGYREFHGVRLAQARGVLIPRPETEELVDFAMARCGKDGAERESVVVDAGCGCGAIAVTLARKSGLNVIAIDVSDAAVELTARNAALCGVSDKVKVLRGSWLEPLGGLDPGIKIDAVISNPPYIRSEGIPDLPRDILLHEPREALDGGPDGLDPIRQLAIQAKSRLSPSGFLAFEFGEDQEEAVAEILRNAGWRGIETLRDMAGHPRIASARP